MQIQKIIENYNFPSDEIRKLEEYRDAQKNADLRCRFIALILLAGKMRLCKVASVVGKSVKTVKRWFKKYYLRGADALNSFDYKPKKPYLTEDQISETVGRVKESRPSDIRIVCDFVSERFGISYSEDAARKLLKKNGLKFLRPKLAPGKPPTEEEQIRFVEEYKEVRLFAEVGASVLFCDAMHLVHQTEPSHCWGDPKDPPARQTAMQTRSLFFLRKYLKNIRNPLS